ncbi:MAG: hypothetical protein Q8P59_06215, partial [Dehalococcoidia bacterium]|nr:hypothetical protein [Dehalococcoidia bacterium]
PIGSDWLMLRFLHVVPFLLMLAAVGCTQGLSEGAGSSSSNTTDWRGVALTDVSTGESFSLSDFKGKVVVLETMAVWCSTYVRQQIEVQALRDRFGDQVVSVTLDIDRNEGQDILRRHVQTYGFEERFAVSPTAKLGSSIVHRASQGDKPGSRCHFDKYWNLGFQHQLSGNALVFVGLRARPASNRRRARENEHDHTITPGGMANRARSGWCRCVHRRGARRCAYGSA